MERSTSEKISDGKGGDADNGDGVEIAKMSGKSKGQKTSKSQKLAKSQKSFKLGKNSSKSENSPNFGATKTGPSFLTPEARLAFNRLWLAFIEAPIFWYIDPECHIWIKIDALSYAIGGVLSQLASGTSLDGIVTKTDLGQWHPVVFFSRKMIPVKTQYKTHDGEFLAIVEAFKTWRHYLEGCRHKILVFMDHNNLRCFMDIKSLNFRQERWAQELSRYHFQIDYR